MIDLALPHDVAPSVVEIPGLTLIALRMLADSVHNGARDDVDAVKRIVTEEVTAYAAARDAARVAPTVVALRTMATGVVATELERLWGRLADLTPEQRAEIEHTLRRVADKLLHEPTVRIKQFAGRIPESSYAEALAELFALDPAAVEAVTRAGEKAVTTIRIGTRASLLARAQSTIVGTVLIDALGVEIELVDVLSAGDVSDRPLTEIGGQGVFVSAVRDAVIAGDVDLVVHSLKDLPTTDDERVQLAAVPVRGDVRDALVARDGLTLGELPAGSRVGTGSPRRAAQLLALGLGLDVVPIRGNVDTRLKKVHAGDLDGVVLARAGLSRIGREDEITETIDPIQMLPAPGQGALAVEVAASASVLADQVRAALDDLQTRAAVTAERAAAAHAGGRVQCPDRRPGRGGRG